MATRLTPFQRDVLNAIDEETCFYSRIAEKLISSGRRSLSLSRLFDAIDALTSAGLIEMTAAGRTVRTDGRTAVAQSKEGNHV